MLLMQDKNWKAVKFDDGRVILRSDKCLYPQAAWEYLVNKIDVEPAKCDGHYKVKAAK